MSRIGRNSIKLPDGVQVSLLENSMCHVKGGKGDVHVSVPCGFDVAVEGVTVSVGVKGGVKTMSRKMSALYGTVVRQIGIAVQGVSTGFEKTLKLVGVGYKAELVSAGRVLKLSLGYSHDIMHNLPDGVDATIEKPTVFKLHGVSKQKVGQVAADIMKYRPPEPYKGKGIQFPGQYIRRKEGKSK
jgi:large subunit ribosomal protein L6